MKEVLVLRNSLGNEGKIFVFEDKKRKAFNIRAFHNNDSFDVRFGLKTKEEVLKEIEEIRESYIKHGYK